MSDFPSILAVGHDQDLGLGGREMIEGPIGAEEHSLAARFFDHLVEVTDALAMDAEPGILVAQA
jgi:hypothetical protein